MRTGAATAVAAKHLARKESSTVGIIACGVQGRSNLEALACEFDLEKVWAYDIHADVAHTFADAMSAALGLEIEVVASAREAVVQSDLVVTSGPILKDPTPTIEKGWLRPGCFGSAVDFDSYWQGSALREADKIVTDDIPQMEHYRDVGYFGDTPKAHSELAEVVCGKRPGRERSSERIIAINLGIAPDDMATAIRIYERAVKKGVGTHLPL
jgi:ornithine cyclodeaminase/alanine dehydrogenase